MRHAIPPLKKATFLPKLNLWKSFTPCLLPTLLPDQFFTLLYEKVLLDHKIHHLAIKLAQSTSLPSMIDFEIAAAVLLFSSKRSTHVKLEMALIPLQIETSTTF